MNLIKKSPKEIYIALLIRLRRLIHFFNPSFPFKVRLSNKLIWYAYGDWVNTDMVISGRFDKKEMQFLDRFLKKGMVALDIGAHFGFYTMKFSERVGSKGKVIAFEPSPINRKRLQKHIVKNNLHNVRIENYAVGSDIKKVKFHLSDENTGSNTLNPWEKMSYSNTLEVDQITLDSYFMGEKTKVDIIKLDVENIELEVLKGATEVIRTSRPFIIMELWEVNNQAWGKIKREDSIVEFLEKFDYQWYSIEDSGLPQLVLLGDIRIQNNYLAVPVEKQVLIQIFDEDSLDHQSKRT